MDILLQVGLPVKFSKLIAVSLIFINVQNFLLAKSQSRFLDAMLQLVGRAGHPIPWRGVQPTSSLPRASPFKLQSNWGINTHPKYQIQMFDFAVFPQVKLCELKIQILSSDWLHICLQHKITMKDEWNNNHKTNPAVEFIFIFQLPFWAAGLQWILCLSRVKKWVKMTKKWVEKRPEILGQNWFLFAYLAVF